MIVESAKNYQRSGMLLLPTDPGAGIDLAEAIEQVYGAFDVAARLSQRLFLERLVGRMRLIPGALFECVMLSVDGVDFRSSYPELDPVRQGQLVDQDFFRSAHWFVVVTKSSRKLSHWAWSSAQHDGGYSK